MGRGRRRRPKGLGWERRRGLMTAIVLVLYAHPSEDCRRRRSLKETQDDAGLGYSPCLFLCCVCRPSQSRPAQGRERERRSGAKRRRRRRRTMRNKKSGLPAASCQTGRALAMLGMGTTPRTHDSYHSCLVRDLSSSPIPQGDAGRCWIRVYSLPVPLLCVCRKGERGDRVQRGGG